jgi:hypothetical protein
MNNQLLNAVSKEGVLLSVSVGYWRARKQLSAGDVNLDASKINSELIRLGHKNLLPKEAFQKLALIESRAHATVESSTFPFLGGIGRYLANTKLEQVTTRLEELEQEFTVEKSNFLRQYPELRVKALESWEEQARELSDEPERLMAVIRNAFPVPSEVERRFRFSVRMFSISVPDVAEADLITLGEQRAVIDARNAAVRRARVEIEDSCQEFIGDCVSALRSETAQLCEDMIKTINTTGSVHQKTLNRLSKFIAKFSEMNFVGDEQMSQELEKVRKEFLTKDASIYRKNSSSKTGLVKGLGKLRQKAQELAENDTTELVESFGQIGQRKFSLAS